MIHTARMCSGLSHYNIQSYVVELRYRATISRSTFTSRKADTQEFYISIVTDPIIYYFMFFKESKILHIYNRHSKIGVVDPS